MVSDIQALETCRWTMVAVERWMSVYYYTVWFKILKKWYFPHQHSFIPVLVFAFLPPSGEQHCCRRRPTDAWAVIFIFSWFKKSKKEKMAWIVCFLLQISLAVIYLFTDMATHFDDDYFWLPIHTCSLLKRLCVMCECSIMFSAQWDRLCTGQGETETSVLFCLFSQWQNSVCFWPLHLVSILLKWRVG